VAAFSGISVSVADVDGSSVNPAKGSSKSSLWGMEEWADSIMVVAGLLVVVVALCSCSLLLRCDRLLFGSRLSIPFVVFFLGQGQKRTPRAQLRTTVRGGTKDTLYRDFGYR
jgi:hypothetical protein